MFNKKKPRLLKVKFSIRKNLYWYSPLLFYYLFYLFPVLSGIK